MNLYIWNNGNTLCDYSSGMIVVLAKDLEEAHNTILKEYNYIAGRYDAVADEVIPLINTQDNEPRAWVCYGGG